MDASGADETAGETVDETVDETGANAALPALERFVVDNDALRPIIEQWRFTPDQSV